MCGFNPGVQKKVYQLTKKFTNSAMTDDGLKVIGAGFGRTGTMSLKAALEILYPKETHHMKCVMPSSAQKAFWERVGLSHFEKSQPEVTDEELVKFFASYDCSVDFPSCVIWERLSKIYPKGKVLLSVRDGKSWYKSCCATIFRMQPDNPSQPLGITILMSITPPFIQAARMLRAIICPVFRADYSEAAVIKVFNEWNRDVQARCPPERLLVFDVKEGWKPLCDFLGKPVPDVPFPHENDTAHFQRMIITLNGIGLAVGLISLSTLVGVMAVAISRLKISS